MRSAGTYRYHTGGTYRYNTGGTYKYHTALTDYTVMAHRNRHCAVCVPNVRMSERQESQAAIYNQNQLPNFVTFCIYSHKTKPADRDTRHLTHNVQREVRLLPTLVRNSKFGKSAEVPFGSSDVNHTDNFAQKRR